ncbi:MAG: choice-of-anchor U domain-containing protein, partial [Candidatus Azotimanducaceae bacterium]
VIWTASDLTGNESTATQTITVIPFVETLSVGRVAEGGSFELKAIMNGEANSYPIDIPISFSGTATIDTDFTASSDTISISSDVEGSISLNIASDSEAEGNETIIATLSSPSAGAGLGAKSTATINIVEAAAPPALQLAVEQNGTPGKFVSTDAGQVNVTLNITDPNGSHAVDWSSTDANLISIGSSETVFAFDPTSLNAGNYKVIAKVTDNEINDATYDASTVLNVTATNAKTDSDGDGISDENDAYTESNLITTDATKTSAPASTDTGLTILAGDAATSSGTEGVRINESTVADSGEDGLGAASNGNDEEYGYPSGIFDFAVENLPVPGESVNIVLPIAGGIPANAVYRKFESTQGWFNFEIDDDNYVSSAAGTSASCPAAGNSSYSEGLNQGDFCLQLTIKDGGANDADGTVNGVVDDPGGLAVDDNPPTVVAPDDANVEAESGSGVSLTNGAVSAFLSGATASDGADGDLTAGITASESGEFVALGDNIVTFTVADSAGNVGSDTATLSVVDTTPPTINPPSATTVSATSGAGIPKSSSSLNTFFNGASASDTVDSSPTITDDAPNTIPVGTTTVTFTATDTSGNSATATSTITVQQQSSSGGSGGTGSGGGGGCSLGDGKGPIDPSLPILVMLALLGIFRYKLGLE